MLGRAGTDEAVEGGIGGQVAEKRASQEGAEETSGSSEEDVMALVKSWGERPDAREAVNDAVNLLSKSVLGEWLVAGLIGFVAKDEGLQVPERAELDEPGEGDGGAEAVADAVDEDGELHGVSAERGRAGGGQIQAIEETRGQLKGLNDDVLNPE